MRWAAPDGRTVEVVSYADDGTTPARQVYRVRHPAGPTIADVATVAELAALGINLAELTERGPS